MAGYLTEKELYKQMRSLGVKPVSRTQLSDWIRRELVPRPQGGGGRSIQREYDAATVPEFYAGMAVLLAGGGKVSKTQVHYIREICLMIEWCKSPEDVLAVASGFAEGRKYGDLTRLGPDVILWLREKRKAARILYGESEEEKVRTYYFESSQFVRLVWGLTNGFYDGYRFEGNRLIAPEKKTGLEFDALKDFPRAA